MLNKILVFIVIIVSFITGYWLNSKHADNPVEQLRQPVQIASTSPVQAVSAPVSVVRAPVAVVSVNTPVIESKRIFFRKLSEDFYKQEAILQNKIEIAKKIVDQLQAKTEDGQAASSIEASLVDEARYRSSLIMLVGLQQDMINMYRSVIQSYKEYLFAVESTITK